jgi:hypothetical protein
MRRARWRYSRIAYLGPGDIFAAFVLRAIIERYCRFDGFTVGQWAFFAIAGVVLAALFWLLRTKS